MQSRAARDATDTEEIFDEVPRDPGRRRSLGAATVLAAPAAAETAVGA